MPSMPRDRAAPVGSIPSVAIVVRRRRALRRALVASRRVGRAWMEAGVLAPTLEASARRARGAVLAAGVLQALEVGIVRRGVPRFPDGATLVVANHVSWLDACVLQAVLPARLVVAAELATVPVLGRICRGFDAILVRPGDVRDARRTVAEIAGALRAGERVLVFPESVPTDGRRVGRFHAALLQAAVETGAPVQPVALRWLGVGGRPTSAVARLGERRRGASLLGVLAAPYLRAEVRVGPPLSVAGRTRRELAALAERFVAASLGLTPVRSEPELGPDARDRRPPRASAFRRSRFGRLVPAWS